MAKPVDEVAQQRRLSKLATYAERKRSPCVDCGGTFHQVAMHFDHVRGVKKANPSSYAYDYGSVDRMLSELDKCEIVCANCHAVRTYNRRWAPDE